MIMHFRLPDIANKPGSAQVAMASALGLIALMLFCAVAFEMLSAQGSAQDAVAALSGKVRQQELIQTAARLADATKPERDMLQSIPIGAGKGAVFIAQVEGLGRNA